MYFYSEILEIGNEFEHINNTDIVYEVLVEFEGGTYMEVEHVRDLTFPSLIGSAGGYLGLFLGWALAHLPDAIENGIFRLKTLITIDVVE